jgi:hypothetical protein
LRTSEVAKESGELVCAGPILLRIPAQASRPAARKAGWAKPSSQVLRDIHSVLDIALPAGTAEERSRKTDTSGGHERVT